MAAVPASPKIYHILPLDRLASVVADGCLMSDALVRTLRRGGTVIGMEDIKARRLTLPVSCNPGTNVGDYVPFYFCPRSVMLYLIYRANHPGLTHQGGQDSIITLEADLREVVEFADLVDQHWAFSLSNAGARYTAFRSSLDELDEINWDAVAAMDFRSSDVKEGKQAEFLLHGRFPWALVRRIGVRDVTRQRAVTQTLQAAAHKPPVHVRTEWYY